MGMVTNKKQGLQYLTFQSFENTGICRHGFSTRLGGVSEGCYESLNLRLNHFDERGRVIENYRIMCAAVGMDLQDLVLASQVHGTVIYDATAEDRGKGIMRKSDIVGVDGLVTDDPGVALVTFFADCVPLYFLDTERKVIGAAHAGWRGSLNNIAGLMVQHMCRKHGCLEENILAGIGPSIGQCCFEVDEPVAKAFYDGLDFASEYISRVERKGIVKYDIDLWGINKRNMLNAGIPSENITIALECTKCNSDKYFSNRVMGNERGSMAGFLQLKY